MTKRHQLFAALAVDVQGRYMATAGLDGQLKIWDIRNFKSEPLEVNPTRPYEIISIFVLVEILHEAMCY